MPSSLEMQAFLQKSSRADLFKQLIVVVGNLIQLKSIKRFASFRCCALAKSVWLWSKLNQIPVQLEWLTQLKLKTFAKQQIRKQFSFISLGFVSVWRLLIANWSAMKLAQGERKKNFNFSFSNETTKKSFFVEKVSKPRKFFSFLSKSRKLLVNSAECSFHGDETFFVASKKGRSLTFICIWLVRKFWRFLAGKAQKNREKQLRL